MNDTPLAPAGNPASQCWVPLRLVPNPTLRLICFPYAGAGAAAFTRWVKHLPPSWDLVALQLPGRAARCGAPPLHDFALAQEEAWRQLPVWLDRPAIFLGHSLGAIMACESARRWLETDPAGATARLRALAVSACIAPKHWPTDRGRALAKLDRSGLVDALRQYNGMPAEVFDDDDVLDMLLPTLKADFDLVASYRYPGAASLSAPILAMHGADDPHVDGSRLPAWADETSGALEIVQCEGDHFFFERREGTVMQLLVEHLQAHANVFETRTP